MLYRDESIAVPVLYQLAKHGDVYVLLSCTFKCSIPAANVINHPMYDTCVHTWGYKDGNSWYISYCVAYILCKASSMGNGRYLCLIKQQKKWRGPTGLKFDRKLVNDLCLLINRDSVSSSSQLPPFLPSFLPCLLDPLNLSRSVPHRCGWHSYLYDGPRYRWVSGPGERGGGGEGECLKTISNRPW